LTELKVAVFDWVWLEGTNAGGMWNLDTVADGSRALSAV
jgi:hypothetical protein